MVVAAGPFATSDSIEMDPLHDLLGIVRSEEPDVLVLVSPWLVSCLCVCMLCTPLVYTSAHIHTHACTNAYSHTNIYMGRLERCSMWHTTWYAYIYIY